MEWAFEVLRAPLDLARTHPHYLIVIVAGCILVFPLLLEVFGLWEPYAESEEFDLVLFLVWSYWIPFTNRLFVAVSAFYWVSAPLVWFHTQDFETAAGVFLAPFLVASGIWALYVIFIGVSKVLVSLSRRRKRD